MKRFHVHVAVSDLERSIGFYSTLFDCEPTVRKSDYAKWMLEDPRINFAISQRARASGVNHLGFQVDSADELTALRDTLRRADASLVEEVGASCCYAKSDKYWITDPQGVAWETFHSLGAIPVYGEEQPEAAACCIPETPTAEASACCSRCC